MVNLAVTEAIFLVGFVALVVATWPDPPWPLVLAVVVAVNVVVPVLLYPFSHTLWLAGDLAFRGSAGVSASDGDALRSDGTLLQQSAMTAPPAQGGAGRVIGPRPVIAALLSALLPDAGQLYAGRRRRGWILLGISLLLLAVAGGFRFQGKVFVLKLAFRPTALPRGTTRMR